jgi:hypothetical protein
MLRDLVPIFIVSFFCVTPSMAQVASPIPLASKYAISTAPPHDFKETVIPITDVKIGPNIQASFGTGFCIDPSCRFIGTNYHVAEIAHPRRIKGERVVERYLATGPDDEGATVNAGLAIESMKYVLSRDLAIFELRRPLSHLHGADYSLEDMKPGQEVEIYAYPKEGNHPTRSLKEFHGAFKGQTPAGLLAFRYSDMDGKKLRPGASGGIVVDKKTQRIVGILNSLALSDDSVALAVPVQSLVEFVTRVKPHLAESIFPSITGSLPSSPDFYPKFVPPPADTSHFRKADPPEVITLRSKAQQLADSMANFIAVQSFEWGTGNQEPSAEAKYEVRVLDGNQRFREYPDGKKEYQNVPEPPLNRDMVSGGEWSELPEMVGTRLGLKIQQAQDATVNSRRVKVFQYRGEVEDRVCEWISVSDFEFFKVKKSEVVDCYGEVWTDEDLNILRISEHLELRGKWKNYSAVVTYGWIKLSDGPMKLAPLTISSQADYGMKTYWCRGEFSRYQAFDSRIRIIAK